MNFKSYKLQNGSELFVESDQKLKVGTIVYTKSASGEIVPLTESKTLTLPISITIENGSVVSIK